MALKQAQVLYNILGIVPSRLKILSHIHHPGPHILSVAPAIAAKVPGPMLIWDASLIHLCTHGSPLHSRCSVTNKDKLEITLRMYALREDLCILICSGKAGYTAAASMRIGLWLATHQYIKGLPGMCIPISSLLP